MTRSKVFLSPILTHLCLDDTVGDLSTVPSRRTPPACLSSTICGRSRQLTACSLNTAFRVRCFFSNTLTIMASSDPYDVIDDQGNLGQCRLVTDF
jgi:hypothetical protein